MTIVLGSFFFPFHFLFFFSLYSIKYLFIQTSYYVIEQCACIIVICFIYIVLYDLLFICLFLVLFNWLFLEDCLESFDFIPFLCRTSIFFHLFYLFISDKQFFTQDITIHSFYFLCSKASLLRKIIFSLDNYRFVY